MADHSGHQGTTAVSAAASGTWALPFQASGSFPGMEAEALADRSGEIEDRLSPAGRHFWTRDGAGHSVLVSLAVAHGAAGLFGAAAGALVWYFVSPADLLPALTALAGVLVAIAGAVVFELARSPRPGITLVGRLLLPLADLLAAGAALWLLGNREFAALLFLVPICVAAIMLSWRGGALIAALSVATFTALSALRTGTLLETWLPQALALMGVAVLLAVCLGAFSGQMAEYAAVQAQRIADLSDQRDQQAAERQHMLASLTQLEEAQALLEQERLLINQQLAELAGVSQRLGEGDLAAVRGLRSGMYGPLDTLASALVRLSQQVGSMRGQQQQFTAQQRAIEAVTESARAQAQLLAVTDAALRELGAAANGLVAEVQRLERGSGELPGVDRHVLFGAMRGLEQQALALASNTAMLGARLAQLQARQSELEVEVRRASQMAAMSALADPAARSGQIVQAGPAAHGA